MQATTIKGGSKVRVLLDPTGGGTYAAPCGFTSKSISLNKALEDVQIPDCQNPDDPSWLGRDTVSLSMSINGEGVLASESVETWLDAFESANSIATKVEIEFPTVTYTYTGLMHVETIEATAPNGRRVTMTVAMQSDGEMTRTDTPAS